MPIPFIVFTCLMPIIALQISRFCQNTRVNYCENLFQNNVIVLLVLLLGLCSQGMTFPELPFCLLRTVYLSKGSSSFIFTIEIKLCTQSKYNCEVY